VPSTLGGTWLKKFKPVSLAYVSGWMRLRGARRRRAVDRGFILSDHADWTGLNDAIEATGAERVFVTHGYTEVFSKWLREQGLESAVVETAYGTEEEENTEDN
ncbi:MAG: DNA ligase-associated DEXH box helicase, partial [Bacteroidota bacterium]